MREVVDLGDDLVEPIDFLHDDLVEILAEISVFETFGQKLGEGLDRHERIPDFMGHAGREVGPKRGAIHQILFLPQVVLGRQIMDDRHCAERIFLVDQAASFDGKGSPRVGIDPLAWRQIFPGLEGFAEKCGKTAADRFDRLVQGIAGIHAENLFGGRVEPANVGLFIRGDDSGRDRFEQRLRESFLKRDFLVEKRVFQHR